MDKLVIIFALLCSLSAEAALYPRVSIEISSPNWTQIRNVMNAVSNKLDRSKLLAGQVEQADRVLATNEGTYTVSWFVAMQTTNDAWPLFRFAGTNTLGSQVTLRAHYHLCPCGPESATNPIPWGPCNTFSNALYSEVSR